MERNTTSQRSELLRGSYARQPKRRYRRQTVVWMPWPLVFATVGLALPFIMLRDAALIFRRVFMDRRTVMFAAWVLATLGAITAVVVRSVAWIVTRTSSRATQAAQPPLVATWHRAMDTKPLPQPQGRHHKVDDTLEMHFPATGRW